MLTGVMTLVGVVVGFVLANVVRWVTQGAF